MTIGLAFLGGLISCLSPCVLPVIPVFLAQLQGGAPASITADGTMVAGSRSRARAVGFLLGFAGVFVLLWVSLGLGGNVLIQAAPSLRPVAGGAIVALGIVTIAGWRPQLSLGRWGGAGSVGGSFVLGTSIAIGWTPCIGPTLGAILSLAAAASSVWIGAVLLVAYAAGMAVPLALVALGIGRARPLMAFVERHQGVVRVVSGGLIVSVGILVATNAFSRLAGLVRWGY